MADRLQDQVRLAALAACGVLDGPPRPHLDRVTTLVTELTGAPISLVSLVDDRRQFFASQVGLDERTAAARGTPLSHSLCQYVVVSDDVLVIDDARLDADLASHLAVVELGVIAYCGVPIRDPLGRTLGSLCAIDTEAHAWTPDDVAILRAFAEAVSAELHTDARYRRLTVDLHRRLLPAALPTGERWHVGAAYRSLDTDAGLGGDLYDAVEGADGSLTLVVGDIVGHDADAAIAMGQLRAQVLALVHHGTALPELVSTLDRSCRSLPNVFCSALAIVRVAADARSASYLSAGAVAPLLVPGGTGAPTYLDDAGGTPIGVAGRRREGTTVLRPGDRLVLFTDGLVEHRPDLIDLGLDRIAGLASAQRRDDPATLADALLADRAARGTCEDDIAVLVCAIS